MTQTALDLIRRFQLEPHVEGGAFRKLYLPEQKPSQRPAHGVIYYLLDVGEVSDFHVLDADEYWLYHAGPDIDIWWLDADDALHTARLGLSEDAEPCVLMPGGTVFGARHVPEQDGATLVSCVTVPEFTYEHYRILDKAEVLQRCPDAAKFFE
jgi:predicted cupin superfamily sugar epimerase